MKIVHYPHPALRFKSRDVTRIDAQLRDTVSRMFELMYEAQGIGLAANQVGLPFRFFIVNLAGEPGPDNEIVFINPEIRSRKGNSIAEEGCLSLPKLYADVRRPEQITIEAFDLNGQGFSMKLDDLPARVVQHESDHLDGILFIDRLTDTLRKNVEPALGEFESAYVESQKSGEIPPDDVIVEQLKAMPG